MRQFLIACAFLLGAAAADAALSPAVGGGKVSSIGASRNSSVDFIVRMAGRAVPGDEILRRQAAALARAAGAAESAVDGILRHLAAFMAAVTGAIVQAAMALCRTLAASFLDDIAAWVALR